MGVVSVTFARLHGEDRIIGAWGSGMLVLAAALLGLALRGAVPNWISAALANSAVIAALVIAMHGLRTFLGQQSRDVVGWGLTAGLFVFLLVYSEVSPHHMPRIVAVSVALIVIAMRGALLLRRHAPAECRHSARFTEFIFWGVATMTAGRVAGILFAEAADPMESNLLNAATFLFYAAFIIVSTLGVMWMEIETLQARLLRAAAPRSASRFSTWTASSRSTTATAIRWAMRC